MLNVRGSAAHIQRAEKLLPRGSFIVNKGVLYAFAAYGMWGFFPIYFKLLQEAPALEILAHRVVWSFLFMILVISLLRGWGRLRSLLTRRIVITYLVASVLLAINWFTYIWAVNSGFIVEASLGYFINPLVNVLLGVVFLRERLSTFQWLPIGIATAGVLYLTINYGHLPWVALVLASSFGLYGLMKKLAPLNGTNGLTLETGLLFLPALGILLLAEVQGAGTFVHAGLGFSLLLAFSGFLTALPLLLFAEAAHLIPLTTLGFIQYVAPTLQFLIGVLLYHEEFTHVRVIGFSIIWFALLLYSANSIWSHRKQISAASHKRSSSRSSEA